jgi:peptide/nickel transport system permease protein
MLAYIIRRLLILPVILIGVSVLLFAMIQFLDEYQRATLFITGVPRPGAMERVIETYGLNDPIHEQYLRWAGEVVRGNLGYSKSTNQPVADAIRHFLPATLELALWSVIPIMGIGIQLGVISAVHHNKFLDHFMRVFSIVGWSFPTFVFGIFMLMIFYAKLDWFPAGRLSIWADQVVRSGEFVRYTQMNTIDALLNLRIDIFWDALRHIVLPVITLSYLSWALLLRVTRSSMLEVLRADYVTTARAKGLKESVVINKHARRNALIPVATMGGLTVIMLLNGVVITETVFNFRGMGWFAANAALNLDVVSVLGFTLFTAVILVAGNLVVDVMYAFLDPRVRLG